MSTTCIMNAHLIKRIKIMTPKHSSPDSSSEVYSNVSQLTTAPYVCTESSSRREIRLTVLTEPLQFYRRGGVRAVLMSVGLPSVCLSVPAVQEQKVCTASVDRQTHHNSLFLSLLMSREEGRTDRGRNQGDFGAALPCGHKQEPANIQILTKP